MQMQVQAHRRTLGVLGALGSAAVLTLGVVATPMAAMATTPTPTTVSFDGETSGAKPNGYATAGQPDVHFYDTSGADLVVGDYGIQSHGLGLAVNSDDASALEIRLSGPTTGIRLAFGNDDPSFTDTTDQAELRLYRGAALVDTVDANVNADDVMNQTVSYSGARLFNRAVFQYVDAAGVPKSLIEIVDDVEVAPVCTVAGDGGDNVLRGTSARDVICGDSGNDTIRGGGGNDLVYSGPGNDTATGGTGHDTVFGGSGRDHLHGSSSGDDLRGGPGRDTIWGDSGRDSLAGNSGRDHCYGGTGHDHSTSCEVKRHIP